MKRPEICKSLMGGLIFSEVVRADLSEEITCNLKHKGRESPSQAASHEAVGGGTMCRDPEGGESMDWLGGAVPDLHN